jgi:hypothetical protein
VRSFEDCDRLVLELKPLFSNLFMLRWQCTIALTFLACGLSRLVFFFFLIVGLPSILHVYLSCAF